jgi:hypothetical protein
MAASSISMTVWGPPAAGGAKFAVRGRCRQPVEDVGRLGIARDGLT